MKDDTGIIFDENMGVKNHVQTVGQWLPDQAQSSLEANIQGYSKQQNVTTLQGGSPLNWPPLVSTAKVNLPAASVGAEYIITWSSVQDNLSGKTFSLNPVGSDTLYKAGVAGPVGISKNTGEAIHVICFESGKWTIVAHT